MSDGIDGDAARHESEELRTLWSALPAPRVGVEADGLPSSDPAASDDRTRAAVEHLRDAWAAHAVEVPEIPFALRRAHAVRSARTAPQSRRARNRPALRFLVLATAAAAVALIFALRHERTSHDVERSGDGLFVASGSDTRVGTDTEEPRELEPSPLPAESVATLVDIPREDFKSRVDGFEFEAAGVRFVLIEKTGGANSSAPMTKEN